MNSSNDLYEGYLIRGSTDNDRFSVASALQIVNASTKYSPLIKIHELVLPDEEALNP